MLDYAMVVAAAGRARVTSLDEERMLGLRVPISLQDNFRQAGFASFT